MWAAHEGNTDDGEAAARGRRADQRPIDLRLDAAAVRRPAGTDRDDQGCSSPAARTSTRRCPTAPARWSRRFRASTTRPPSVLLDLGVDPNASGQGWTALHQIVVVAAAAARPEQSGPEAAGEREQPRSGAEAGRARRRHQRARDEGAELRHGRAQQPEPLRRHAALPGGEVVRRADDAGAAASSAPIRSSPTSKATRR